MTPFSSPKTASVHQKHPPPKTAISVFSCIGSVYGADMRITKLHLTRIYKTAKLYTARRKKYLYEMGCVMKLRGIEFGRVWGASGVLGFFGEGYWFHPYLKRFGLDFT